MVLGQMMVPTESIPAIIGHAGLKIKDIQKASRTNLHIIKKPDVDILSLVEISGTDICSVERAKKLINLAVKHYFAAVSKPNSKSSYVKSEWHEAALDARTFWAEICRRK